MLLFTTETKEEYQKIIFNNRDIYGYSVISAIMLSKHETNINS